MIKTGSASLHVVFGMSAAGSVQSALAKLGIQDRVIGLADDLSYGPIDPPSSDVRRAWAEDFLCVDFADGHDGVESFWTEATATDAHPVAWVCATYAPERAGFYEFVWRMAGRPFDIVDATHLEVPSTVLPGTRWVPWTLGIMSAEDIIASGLASRRAAFPADDAASIREDWRRLVDENAPFRVLRDYCLVSAPLTHFDPFLVQHAVDEWQKAARLIGETMGRMILDLNPPGQCPSDTILFARMLALGELGVLDVEGRGPDMRDYRVRRKA